MFVVVGMCQIESSNVVFVERGVANPWLEIKKKKKDFLSVYVLLPPIDIVDAI